MVSALGRYHHSKTAVTDNGLSLPASVLSIDTASACSEFISLWPHHSGDPERIAVMLGSYYDESAVDGSGPVSAIGGLVLDYKQYSDIGLEWNRALARHDFPQSYIHMKDFGDDNPLANYPHDLKRMLLTDLAWIIEDNKFFSVESTLTPSQYKEHFGFLKKARIGKKYKEDEDERLSIHSACFMQAAVLHDKWAEECGYEPEIPFMLDEGCPDRDDIDRVHTDLRFNLLDRPVVLKHLGGIMWQDDKKIPALQAADVIAWAVRRKAAHMDFDKGTEPLTRIFEKLHMPSHFEGEWMKESASRVRGRLGR
jgi:hypothetical protein